MRVRALTVAQFVNLIIIHTTGITRSFTAHFCALSQPLDSKVLREKFTNINSRKPARICINTNTIFADANSSPRCGGGGGGVGDGGIESYNLYI